MKAASIHGVNGAPPAQIDLRLLAERDLPCTDGEPMPDSGQQFDAIGYTCFALRSRYDDRDDVAIEGDMFMYYLPSAGAPPPLSTAGDPPYPRTAPDCLVSFGGRRRDDRTVYMVADDGVPDFILEVASNSTWRRDYREKREIYQSLGVCEYFVFDARPRPRTRHRVLGLQLSGGRYEPIAPRPMAGGGAGVRSAALGLNAYADAAGRLRWRDACTGEELLTPVEEAAARRAAERERDRESNARQAAEQRLAAMAAELDRLRGIIRKRGSAP